MEKIPFLDLQAVHLPHQSEIDAAAERVLHSGQYLRGEETKRFEQAYAAYIGTHHCIGVSNGLDALTLILRAYMEIGQLHIGDEVIVPANTYIATILAITENGLTPILIEPDPETLQMDANCLESKITSHTRAIMLVHLYGRCAYTQQIKNICSQHQLLLIEDNAQAHGCQYHGRRTGSLGNAAAHSFYPTKPLGALGDAGAVTTNDSTLAQTIRTLANYGSSQHYHFDHQGRNCRIDEIQAAILAARLPHLDQENQQRCTLAEIYYAEINNPLIRLPRRPEQGQHVYHLFPIFTPRRDQLKQFLEQRGILTDIHYPIPPHKQKAAATPTPCQKACQQIPLQQTPLPITETLHQQELSLPLNTALTPQQAHYIAQQINQFE